jgi:hypothetical protein
MQPKSSAIKLHNDVLSYEKQSDKFIPSDSYYVIKIHINSSEITKKEIKVILKEEASNKFDEESPLAAYMFQNDLYILFSSLEDKSHYLKGSHQKICSTMVSKYALKYKCDIECSIIELDARIKVLVYFQTKIYEASKFYAWQLLKKTKTEQEVKDLTFGEIEDALAKSKQSIKWEEIDSFEKYGIFYKYVKSRDSSKLKYSFLSELVNSENIEKFRKYLFG